MVDKRDTMLRAAYTAEGAKHSKSVIFWLGGGWKVLAVVALIVAAFVFAVKGVPVIWHEAGGLAAPIALVTLLVLVAFGLSRIGRRGGRR